MPNPGWPRFGRDDTHGLHFGADYNPEQWAREVWHEDVALMRKAGFTIVSLGIFAWSSLQPDPHTWDFSWLDEVLDLLDANGIGVDLGTATASPPPWLALQHPEILPVDQEGRTLGPASRQHWRPTSPIFRGYALQLVDKLATRYRDHPTLRAWHVSNELGGHNAYDFSDDAARAFRTWLRERYPTLDELNLAWGTTVWSQKYSDWEQVSPPRLAPYHPNPTAQLDFKRFSSDALKSYLSAERDILHRVTPDIPVTTNFMISGNFNAIDYESWTDSVDFVSNDHYLIPEAGGLDELSFSANLTSAVSRGKPWFLMEHAAGAASWRPVNIPKRSGDILRDALTHIAHGADAICFFQWRQSRSGAEKYHSAVIPHAGPDSQIFRDVIELGQILHQLAPVFGSTRKPSQVAILFDWESWWAVEQDSHPSERLRYRDEVLGWFVTMRRSGLRADIILPGQEFDQYGMLVAPMLHLIPKALSQRLDHFVTAGGNLITTYFSGIVDEDNRIWPGSHPGALRTTLGISVEEFVPLEDGQTALLDDGRIGSIWSEIIHVHSDDVTVLCSYRSGDQSRRPAITQRQTVAGSATYVSTQLGPDDRQWLLEQIPSKPADPEEIPAKMRESLEIAIRQNASEEFWFLINHSNTSCDLPDLPGDPLLGERTKSGTGIVVPRSGIAVQRRARESTEGLSESP